MANNLPLIQFHLNYPFSLKNRRLLKKHILQLFEHEQKELESLSYIFCSDEQLHKLNHQFLQHDTYTDILTFPLSVSPFPIIGEVYISIERIRDNASHLDLPFLHELIRVMFHGCLHLCGYKDKTSRQKAAMTLKEDFYLTIFLQGST